MKKLINVPDDVVADALRRHGRGAPLARASTSRTRSSPGPAARRPGKVGLVSGGGSGHEPLHGGFVGYGMLDAACPGEVFTSPVPDQMLAATKAVDGGAGVLHIVKNYTGDVLNFQMAAELAADEGIEVDRGRRSTTTSRCRTSLYTAGRRGTGATVFVEKIAGALAEQRRGPGRGGRRGARGQRAVPVLRRRADLVHRPGRRRSPSFDLREDEIELGVGIHGEPGRTRGPMRSAAEIADVALDAIDADMPARR